MDRQAGFCGSSNMADLFSACFLVAVTQHAGSSHVIIGGENGNPWQLMQGLNHVHSAKAEDSAGGSFSCQWRLCTHRRGFFCHYVALAGFPWVYAYVHCLERQGLFVMICHWYEVMKCFRKCCRTFAGRTSFISASLSLWWFLLCTLKIWLWPGLFL